MILRSSAYYLLYQLSVDVGKGLLLATLTQLFLPSQITILLLYS